MSEDEMILGLLPTFTGIWYRDKVWLVMNHRPPIWYMDYVTETDLWDGGEERIVIPSNTAVKLVNPKNKIARQVQFDPPPEVIQ